MKKKDFFGRKKGFKKWNFKNPFKSKKSFSGNRKLTSSNTVFKKNLKQGLRKFKLFMTKRGKIFYTLLGLIGVVLIVYIILNMTFLADQHTIKQINFTQGDVKQFYNQDLYKDLKKSLLGENFFIIKYWKKGGIVQMLKDRYHIIDDIDINRGLKDEQTGLIKTNEVIVQMKFKKPEIIFDDSLRKFGLFQNELFEINSGSNLISGMVVVKLPEYVSKLQFLTGFFYQVSGPQLSFQINEIINFVGRENISDIKYLPGGSKTLVHTMSGVNLYFDNLKEISVQLDNYYIVQKKLQDINKIQALDLGNENFVIIKKYE